MRAAPGRRRFLEALGVAGATLTLERWLGAQRLSAPPEGQLLRLMPLGRLDGRPTPPLHTLLGTGLDARQFTDLTDLAPDRLITSTGHFFIRTSHPPTLPPAASWQVVLGGRVRSESTLAIDAIRAQSQPMGIHLMECSGNADPANFGLLSAARWDGVPVTAILDRMPTLPDGRHVRITGIDDEDTRSDTSVPSASWIYSLHELQQTGAFLATQMNGMPLTPDHGAPLRLVVPNYYGCSCIKWVSRIDVVGDDEPATLQMREFASRTHQRGVPSVASEYQPPVIDLTATPIRVEQWLVQNRVVYRIVGIRWGGSSRKTPLEIRMKGGAAFVPVDDCPDADSNTTWSLWSHAWHPDATGRYQIVIRAADRSLRTRRLDLYFYTREVEIDRI